MITKKNANKRYFKAQDGVSVAQPMERAYLLRYHDEESSSIQNEGPFSSEKEAIKALSLYLKDGICSWIVSYNG
tara:strand:- start:1062 stop:1283 length:222 start_codon:yes stop_codon:yes gene_type:complete